MRAVSSVAVLLVRATVAAAVGVTGCRSQASFVCAGASDCVDHGVDGTCEPSGSCSFPDAECASGRRYGTHAADGLGGTCVPSNDETSTGDSESTTSASGVDTLTAGPSDGTETTIAGSTSDSDSADATSGSSSSAQSSSSSGDPPPPCPSFVDDFEDGVVEDGWALTNPDEISESGGELVLLVTAEIGALYPAAAREAQDLSAGYVRVQLGQLPASAVEQIFVTVEADTESVYFRLLGTQLSARQQVGGMDAEIGTQVHDPASQAWLQIRFEDDVVHYEASADGVDFETLWSSPSPLDPAAASPSFAGGNFEVLARDSLVSAAHFEMCAS